MSTVKDILSDVKEAKALVAAREHHGGSSATALHCSSPCKDQKVVKDEGKTGTSEEAKRKTTLELEEELAKKYAAGVVTKKAKAAAKKKSSC